MRLRLLGALLLWAQAGLAQGAPGGTVAFHFDNPALQPARYSLVVAEDGSGRYHSEPAGASNATDAAAAAPLDRAITLADPLRSQLFAAARKHHLFAMECDAGRRNVAFTGNKTLSYSGPEGAGSCTFNYPGDPRLEQVADNLIAVANTVEEGRKLELLLSHDRLGLDAELELLSEEQADGRALDLQNIASVLRAIESDEAVLHRTRGRAAALLAASGPQAGR